MAIYDRHEWLAGRVESAIDPDRPIIDPHHHLWDRDDSRYLAQELRTDARSSHNVTHTVFVECSAAYDPVICSPVADETMAPVGETRFVAEQAAEALRLGGPEIAGIVGHVDLTMGERVAEVLVEHEARGAGLFRGVRHGTNWSPHPDVKNGHHQPGPHLLANPDFRAGVAQLGDAGYTFDAWLYFDQMQSNLTRAFIGMLMHAFKRKKICKLRVHLPKAMMILALLSGSGYSSQEAPEALVKHPNVLFISLDDMNDWIGPMGGHPQAMTPNLDSFAEQAVTPSTSHP